MIGQTLLAVVATCAVAVPASLAAPSSQAEGERGMVVSAQHEASAVGLRILAAGGNAVDAAVAGREVAGIVGARAEGLAADPAAAAIFLRPDGTPYREGDRLIQSDLAASLALIAREGPDAFYRGPIAAAVGNAAAAHGGLLTAE